MAELPRAGIRRLIEAAGVERISKKSVIAARDLAEQFCKKIAEVSVCMANHSGRKTVSKADVEVIQFGSIKMCGSPKISIAAFPSQRTFIITTTLIRTFS